MTNTIIRLTGRSDEETEYHNRRSAYPGPFG